MKKNSFNLDQLHRHLDLLNLPFSRLNAEELAQQAALKHCSHLDYLLQLLEGEVASRHDKRVARLIKAARFPVLKSLEGFRWDWPTLLNRSAVQHLFTLSFLPEHHNVIFMGTVGLGKTHLASALGLAACQAGHSVLFTTAINMVNTLSSAHSDKSLSKVLPKYLKPQLLILDELGYLPIDAHGANLLFQVFSGRYERGSTIITTNRAFKQWPAIFNNDSMITSGVLDRVLHHAHTVVIEGKSFRMKDIIDHPKQ